jgi:hypothetical protein
VDRFYGTGTGGEAAGDRRRRSASWAPGNVISILGVAYDPFRRYNNNNNNSNNVDGARVNASTVGCPLERYRLVSDGTPLGVGLCEHESKDARRGA